MKISAERWPWQQGYGWKSEDTDHWMKSRFGGGWDYKLGIEWGGKTVLLNLLFGMIAIKRGK